MAARKGDTIAQDTDDLVDRIRELARQADERITSTCEYDFYTERGRYQYHISLSKTARGNPCPKSGLSAMPYLALSIAREDHSLGSILPFHEHHVRLALTIPYEGDREYIPEGFEDETSLLWVRDRRPRRPDELHASARDFFETIPHAAMNGGLDYTQRSALDLLCAASQALSSGDDLLGFSCGVDGIIKEYKDNTTQE